MSARVRKATGAMRKHPRQSRSRATLDVIVEAAARVLGHRGWAAFNTNVVAAAAGVSIGTLYQYFPNKVALVEAIRRRHFEEISRALAVSSDETRAIAERVDALIESLVVAHGDTPALYRALLDDAPKTEEAERENATFERSYQEAFERLVAGGSRAKAGASAVGTAARVLAAAVEGVIHDAARRGALESRALRKELKALTLAFILAPRP